MDELGEIYNDPIPNVLVVPLKNDIKTWVASIKGPKGTPYEGGTFLLRIEFPDDYPASRPIFRMLTPIFHVNISKSGEVCLDILRSDYKPENKIGYMISCITWLLANPNGESPFHLVGKILFDSDREGYEALAKQFTLEYAMGN